MHIYNINQYHISYRVPLVIIHFNGISPYKPSILGYLHLWKPPFFVSTSVKKRRRWSRRIIDPELRVSHVGFKPSEKIWKSVGMIIFQTNIFCWLFQIYGWNYMKYILIIPNLWKNKKQTFQTINKVYMFFDVCMHSLTYVCMHSRWLYTSGTTLGKRCWLCIHDPVSHVHGPPPPNPIPHPRHIHGNTYTDTFTNCICTYSYCRRIYTPMITYV